MIILLTLDYCQPKVDLTEELYAFHRGEFIITANILDIIDILNNYDTF